MERLLLSYPTLFSSDRNLYGRHNDGRGSILIKNNAIAFDGNVILLKSDDQHGSVLVQPPESHIAGGQPPVKPTQTGDIPKQGHYDQLRINRMANSEAKSIDLIDSYIDTHNGSAPLDHGISLQLGKCLNGLKDFVHIRNHLWTMSSDEPPMIQKVPEDTRQLIRDIMKFIQPKRNRYGVQLQDICGQFASHRASMKHQLGKKSDGIKQFLLKYPMLFLMHPFDPNGQCSFINVAMFTQPGTIILHDENEEKLNTSKYWKGRGKVKMLQEHFGYITDTKTKKDVRFEMDSFKNVGQCRSFNPHLEYMFEAVMYPVGRNGKRQKGNWKIFNLEPVID